MVTEQYLEYLSLMSIITDAISLKNVDDPDIKICKALLADNITKPEIDLAKLKKRTTELQLDILKPYVIN